MAGEDVLTMTLDGAFLEAHSYAGGLRFTPFTAQRKRPAWAPAPDLVGWKDDFALGDDDAVVEFHQRGEATDPISWIAVFRRSIDARFGDRQNHAGIGVWLHGRRLSDGTGLIQALEQLTRTLAERPDPEALSDTITDFTRQFLPKCLIPATALPPQWRGLSPAAATLVETRYLAAPAAQFETVAGRIGDELTRLSLGWSLGNMPARTLMLVTSAPAPPRERRFEPLPPSGSLLPDLIEALPHAFEHDREQLREAEREVARARGAWEKERDAQQRRWDKERDETQRLDRMPPTLEGVAMRLNRISGQLDALARVPAPTYPPLPSFVPPRAATTPVRHSARHPVRSVEGEHDPDPLPMYWIAAGGLLLVIAVVLIYLIATSTWSRS